MSNKFEEINILNIEHTNQNDKIVEDVKSIIKNPILILKLYIDL